MSGKGLVPRIAPSMLSSDFANLASEAARMKAAGADYLHMDVMDGIASMQFNNQGHFVPNLTLGAPIIKALRKHTDLTLDCHLMVSNPEQWVDDFAAAGADLFTFHIEATKDARSLIEKIHLAGMKAGISLKPDTNIEQIFPFTDMLDQVLIMTVEPGFGGQAFMPEMLDKIKVLRNQCRDLDISVDGGISRENIDLVSQAGANIVVAGSSIFGATDVAGTIAHFRAQLLNQSRNLGN